MAPPRGGKIDQPCFNMQKTGKCRFGTNCHYSHDISFRQDDKPSPRPSRMKAEETPEQQQAKAHYNSWKRHIKNRPKPNDTRTMELLWEGAVIILNSEDRDWKQMLPRDLDDQENYGREHMHVVLMDLERFHSFSVSATALLRHLPQFRQYSQRQHLSQWWSLCENCLGGNSEDPFTMTCWS